MTMSESFVLSPYRLRIVVKHHTPAYSNNSNQYCRVPSCMQPVALLLRDSGSRMLRFSRVAVVIIKADR